MRRARFNGMFQHPPRRNQSLKTSDGWFRCDFSKKLISAIISGSPVWTTYGFDAKMSAPVCVPASISKNVVGQDRLRRFLFNVLGWSTPPASNAHALH